MILWDSMGFCYLFVQQPSQDPYDRREAQLVPRSYQGPASRWWGAHRTAVFSSKCLVREPVLENVENQFLPDEHQFASFPESTRHFPVKCHFLGPDQPLMPSANLGDLGGDHRRPLSRRCHDRPAGRDFAGAKGARFLHRSWAGVLVYGS